MSIRRAACFPVAVLLSVSACDAASPSCTPGISIACTGPGGCVGGQVCNGDGIGYGACDCGGTDAGRSDAGASDAGTSDAGTSDASVEPPTAGALRIRWTLTDPGGAPLTCDEVAGENGVSVNLVATGGSPIEALFDCETGEGLVPHIAFGTYATTVSILDAGDVSIGDAPGVSIAFAASPCDELVEGECVQARAVEIVLR